MASFRLTSSAPLTGDTQLPGDKSISHRAVMISSISRRTVDVRNFLASEDCLRTVDCFRSMGVRIDRDNTRLKVHGVGLFGLKRPRDVLYVGNSGTTIRLMMGILAGQPFEASVDGDKSIRNRPMDRVAVPLTMMGAAIKGGENGNFAPLSIRGGKLKPIEYEMPVASAQVKSAVLLAGLYASGRTSVIEKTPTRDHTERMLQYFGAKLLMSGQRITVEQGSLEADSIAVPSDISSAAFAIVGACLIPGSEIVIKHVGVNPGRTGIIDVLRRMGADIEVFSEQIISGEPIADIRVKYSRLSGVELSGSIIPRVIDELPVIALAASLANGTTLIKGASELRVKESDRIRTTAAQLNKFGADIAELEDGFRINGVRALASGAECKSFGDHRIAMLCAVAGLISGKPTVVQDVDCVETSFPGFAGVMNGLAGRTCIETSR